MSPAQQEKEAGLPLHTEHERPPRPSRRTKLAAALVLGLLVLSRSPAKDAIQHRLSLHTASIAPPLGFPDKIQRRWGQYSPYFPAGAYVPPPAGCAINQVNILQRHGARYPNAEDDYDRAVKHLRRAKKYSDSGLYFLKDYTYDLHTDVLVPYGAEQSFESGEAAFRRYGHLVSEHNQPFVRASSKPRVVASAGNWTVGFAAASHHHYNPAVALVLPETRNSTLNNACPAAADGLAQAHAWLRVFAPPVAARLRAAAQGSRVSEDDVHRLMALCPFETLARERPSAFCGLFADDEFRALEYFGDVEKYYKTGYGNPLGRIQGAGYTNELLARLTGRPPSWDRTTHDATQPFPLGRALYADFTHENLMVAVYAALGLFDLARAPLDPQRIPADGDARAAWRASRMVPFSARMVVERLACAFPGGEPDDGEEDEGEGEGEGEEGEYVRIFVNDELQPLAFCRGDAGASGGNGKLGAAAARAREERDGLCTLDAFVKSQRYARKNGHGDFERCWQ